MIRDKVTWYSVAKHRQTQQHPATCAGVVSLPPAERLRSACQRRTFRSHDHSLFHLHFRHRIKSMFCTILLRTPRSSDRPYCGVIHEANDTLQPRQKPSRLTFPDGASDEWKPFDWHLTVLWPRLSRFRDEAPLFVVLFARHLNIIMTCAVCVFFGILEGGLPWISESNAQAIYIILRAIYITI